MSAGSHLDFPIAGRLHVCHTDIYMASTPDVHMHCLEGTYPAIAPALRDGSLDFALTPIREEDLEPELEAEHLYHSEVVIVARKQHPLAQVTRLKDLQQARWAPAR